MTVPPLSEAFIRRLRAQFGGEAQALLAAMEMPPTRGLRINPHKTPDQPLSALVAGIGGAVPWAENGFYLTLESAAGLHPLQDAGAYYLQEPSAMLPAALLAVQPDETVLDLCAAPGGKATQLAAAMAGRGTLVANDVVPARAQVLSRNLERMGVPNSLVVSADPARLAQAWPSLFDAILVDAPCSGEGMFRRHPETRLEWDEGAPERCALRQKKILESACAMLKPGGRLCYSTCTLNCTENEEVIAAFRIAHPEFEPAAFSVPLGEGRAVTSIGGCVRLAPHQVMGEGHFAALLIKTAGMWDAASACTPIPAEKALRRPDQPSAEAYASFLREFAARQTPVPNAMLGDTLLAAPVLPPLNGIRVLRAGLALGRMKGKVFAPDHALAVVAPAPWIRPLALDAVATAAYLRGETLPAPQSARGWYAATYGGLALGLVKAADGTLKNHYPKGLRRPSAGVTSPKGDDDGDH